MITGASGFVGASLTNWIIKHNKCTDFNRIYLISRNKHKYRDLLLPKNIEIIEKDLSQNWNFNFQVDTVINLATDSSINPYSKESNRKYLLINKNLIEWARNNCQRIIHASSGAAKWHESSTTLNQLDKSKQLFIKTRAEVENELEGTFKERAIICRLFSFIGVLLTNKEQYAINSFIKQGLESKVINVTGNPNSTRSYLSAEDMSNWIYQVLNLKGHQGKFEIGSEYGYRLSEVASIVAMALKADVKLPIYDKYKINENYVAESAMTKTILGVSETITIPVLIYEYIKTYKQKFNYE
jgi:nucleoside-diphosphate-sugar epimerase